MKQQDAQIKGEQGATLDAESGHAFAPARHDPLPARSLMQNASAGDAPTAAPQVEGYQITGSLGQGGMGSVWRAWQLSTRREVALKFLNLAASSSEKARRRFDREVEATSRLQHPHIARIYDSGVLHGVYFYAMELIEGRALDSHVKALGLSQRDILKLMRTICQAVQHAHQRGVIHRDLKPSNILVDAAGDPHVLDFGLAKVFEVNDAGSVVSMEGEIAGTPAFMSPEQAAGRFDQLDTRTDVYSLGVVLYLLLTGNYPHDISGAGWEVLQRIAEAEVARPRSVSRHLDRELEAVLLKALARDPEQRYASAGALAQDIDNYLAGEPLAARQPTTFYFLKKRLWQHRGRVLVAGAIAVSMLCLITYSSIKIKRAHDQTVVERDRAQKSAEREQSLRREEQILLADNLVPFGDKLAAGGELRDARRKYRDARSRYLENGRSTLGADIGLSLALDQSPPLLCRLDSANVSDAVFAADSGSIYFARSDAGTDTIIQWDPRLGSQTAIWTAPKSVQSAIRFAADGQAVRFERSPQGGGFKCAVINLRTGKLSASADLSGDGLGSNKSISSRGGFVVYLSETGQPPANTDTIPPVIGPVSKVSLVIQSIQPPGPASVLGHDIGSRRPVICLGPADKSVLLLAGAKQRRLTLWDCATHALQKTIVVAPDAMTLACSPVEPVAWAGGLDGSIAAWNLETGEKIHQLETGSAPITHLAISSNGHFGVLSDDAGVLKMWDTSTARIIATFESGAGPIQSMAFSPDGKLVVSTDASGIKVWTVPRKEDRLLAGPARIMSAAFSRDGRTALVGSVDSTTSLIDLATRRPLLQMREEKTEVGAVIFGRMNDAFAYHRNGTIEQWDLSTGKRLICWGSVRRLATSPNGNPAGTRAIAVLAPARLYNLQTGTSRTLDVSGSAPSPCGFSETGADAFVADPGGTVDLYNGDTGQRLTTLHISGGPTATAISSAARLAFVGEENGRVMLTDFDGRVLWDHLGHSGRVTDAVLSRDATVGLTGGADGTMRLWHIESGRQVRVLADKTGWIHRLFLSPDGSALVISRGEDAGVEFRDFAMDARRDSAEEPASRPQNPTPSADDDLEAGKWFNVCGQYAWARTRLEQARARGATVPPITLGRIYWILGDYDKARVEFNREIDQNRQGEYGEYLRMCLGAIQRDSSGGGLHPADTSHP